MMLRDFSLNALPAGIPRDTLGTLATVAVATIASVLLWLYVWESAPVVPIWDAWLWIAQARAFLDGGVGAIIRDVGLANNEHLYALPSLIFLLAGPWVDYSQRLFALTAVALLVAFGVFFYGVARSSGLGRFGALLVFLVVVSFRHYENLLIGFQFGLVLSVFAGAAAVVMSGHRPGWARLAAAVSLALVSAASSAVGVIALGLVITIGIVDWRGPKRIVLAGIGLGVFVLLCGIALYYGGLMGKGYFAAMAKAFHGTSVAGILVGWARVMGGGLVAERAAATATGLASITWLVGCLAEELRRDRRISGLSGLALFSLFSTLAVAWGRLPVVEVASRWAIFATPGIGVGLIWLLLRLTKEGKPQPALQGALAFLIVWLAAFHHVDAGAYRQRTEAWAAEVRAYLVDLKTGGMPTIAEIGRVNPGPPDFILKLMTFYNRNGPSEDEGGPAIEVLRMLPSSVAPGATIRQDGELLALTGPGYTYNRLTCAQESGCLMRLAVDVSTTGKVTVGIIVRNPDGTERVNANHPVPANSSFSVQTVSVSAAFREMVDAYVFCFTSDDTARIREFKVLSIAGARQAH